MIQGFYSANLIHSIDGWAARRARKRPGKFHADRTYASRVHRAWLCQRDIACRIACYGVESHERKGKCVEPSNELSAGSIASAGYAFATSAKSTFTRHSLHVLARWSARNSLDGFVTRS